MTIGGRGRNVDDGMFLSFFTFVFFCFPRERALLDPRKVQSIRNAGEEKSKTERAGINL
jgi:hypothetical protein